MPAMMPVPSPNPSRRCVLSIIAALLLSILIVPDAIAQRKVIDPVRPGDKVEYKYFSDWNPAEVVDYANGVALLKYEWGSTETTRKYPLKDIRFPNDEGSWMVWSDASGKFRIEARLIGRDETHVTLRKADGTDAHVPIDQLSQSLQNQLAKIAGAVKKMHEESLVRVDDQIEVKIYSTWYPGTVLEIMPGGALVAYQSGSKTIEKEFQYDDMRYPNGEGPWREWVDSTGENKVTARYIMHDEQSVGLLREGGKRIRIPRDKLSRKLQSELNKATIFTRRPDEVDFALATSEFSASSGWMSFGTTLPDFQIDQLEMGPGEPSPKFDDGGFEFFVGGVGQVKMLETIGTDRQLIAIGVDAPKSKTNVQPTTLYWASLTDRKAYRGPNFLSDEILLAYSARQGRLLTAEVRGTWSTPVRFCSYRLKPGGKTAVPELKWSVPESRFASSSNDTQVKFLDDDRVLIGYGGNVGLWNLASQNMEYVVPSSGNAIGLSPDKKYFCTDQFSHCVFVETSSGKPIANLKHSSMAYFSEDGRYLVADARGGWGSNVYDSAEPGSIVYLPDAARRSDSSDTNFSLVTDGWLSDGRSVWSMARGILAWTYTSSSSGMKIVSQTAFGDKLLAVGTRGSDSQMSVLVGVATIPQAAAIAANDAVDDQKLYVLKRGVRISIDPAVTDARMLDGIRRAAANWDWVIDPASDLVVTASAGPGQHETRTYERSRFGFGSNRNDDFRETISVTPWVQSLSISQNGKRLWSTGQGGMPGMVMLREGDSLQAQVADSAKPSYSLFSTFEFPERVIAPKYANGLGTSLITPNGLEDHPVD
ncbi:hypothetical protein K227x_46240 [Rubripirellula lacrimiformis]|uniref:SLA1 homology domain-containing protein n=1 Tax=Rubripirellula lacrimiformis TaxID=1930273 RepID=A0A517NGF4_9BACT|nr:SHD1 domain-containing protein [Rubripirellula lacrimiformis]QDT06216.1 hypothetical protein K227x_46240 [Rubripirellula lacrimiformis]